MFWRRTAVFSPPISEWLNMVLNWWKPLLCFTSLRHIVFPNTLGAKWTLPWMFFPVEVLSFGPFPIIIWASDAIMCFFCNKYMSLCRLIIFFMSVLMFMRASQTNWLLISLFYFYLTLSIERICGFLRTLSCKFGVCCLILCFMYFYTFETIVRPAPA